MKIYNPFISLDCIKKHSTEIIAFIEGEKIQVKTSFGKEWKSCNKPAFLLNYKYRIAPKLLFKNDIGEEFTEEDVNNDIKVYFFSYPNQGLVKRELVMVQSIYYNNNNFSSAIYKTKIGALVAAAEYYKELNNKSLNK